MSVNDDREQQMIDRLGRSLDDSVDNLDAATLSRLNQARQQALETRSQQRTNWLMATAFASVLLVVGSVMLSNTTTHTPDEAAYIADIDDLELIDDLEFVSWLAEQDNAG